MKRFLLFLLLLSPMLTSAQLIGRKKPKMYLYKYNDLTRDGTLLFEIDVRMAGVIDAVKISNRKKFLRKTFLTYVAERDYQYAGKDGFIIRIQLASMRKMIGWLSDTATVDITVYEAGKTVGWKRSMKLDKNKLRKTHYIRFR